MPANSLTFRITHTLPILLAGITLMLTSCGGGSDSGSPSGPANVITSNATACHGAPANPQSPYLVICYPTPYANVVAATSTVVSGRIIDPAGNPISAGDITSINVNGHVATLDPTDPSYWSVSIPVVPGQSTTVDAIATFSTVPDSTVSMVVTNSALLSHPIDMALDTSTGNTAYITDFDTKSVIYENLDTGERYTFSGNGAGTGTAFSDPRSAAVDNVRGLLYVSDVGQQKIVKVDLSTGNRLGVIPTPAITSGCNPTDATLELCYPERILYDAANNRLLIQDSTEKAIMAVNVVSGAISLIADSTTTAAPGFNAGYGMALDSANNRLLIAEYNYKALSAIDLSTGARTVISDASTGTGAAFVYVIDVVLDSTNNRAIVLDSNAVAVLAVDLTTGDRSIISDSTKGSGQDMLDLRRMTGLPGSGQVYVLDFQSLLSISLNNGNRVSVSDAPVSGPRLLQPVDAAWDYVNGRLLAIGAGGSNLFAAKLDTGIREIIADQTITPALPLSARQLGTNRTSLATLTGGRTQIVDMLNLGRIELSAASDTVATIDYANHRTLSYNNHSYDITATDLDTGTETVVANLQALTPPLYYGSAMVYDADNDRLLMTATTLNSSVTGLYAIDMAGNTATVVTTQSLTQAQWKKIVDLSLDPANNRVYALLSDLNASSLLSFDLTSGAGTYVSAATKINFQNPLGMYVDTESRRAFVADYSLPGIFVFDLATGQRALALR